MPITRDYAQGAAVAAGATIYTATGLCVCLLRVVNISAGAADITVTRVVSGGGNTRALMHNRTVPVGATQEVDQITLENGDALHATASADTTLVWHLEVNGIT